MHTSPFEDPRYLHQEALELLRGLISTPSFSKEEGGTADLLHAFLTRHGLTAHRHGHNVWAKAGPWRDGRPTLLLNSHHDTVRPSAQWQRHPFTPTLEDGRLYGLGSNDAGGPLVCLIATFLYGHHVADWPFNLVLAATAEEEISGHQGIAALLPHLPPIDFGMVGEPTQMRMATAERGLLVLDAVVKGRAGHAARDEGLNAIYLAMQDIAWIQTQPFDRVSPLLGPVKATVTQIQAGHQHNVVPDTCTYVVDVRTQECYTPEEVLDLLQRHTHAQLTPRSLRLRPSGIPHSHPLVQAGLALGLPTFGSATLSDQALCPFPTIKIGPGDSARSHTADEFITLDELEEGIHMYRALLERLGAVSKAI